MSSRTIEFLVLMVTTSIIVGAVILVNKSIEAEHAARVASREATPVVPDGALVSKHKLDNGRTYYMFRPEGYDHVECVVYRDSVSCFRR